LRVLLLNTTAHHPEQPINATDIILTSQRLVNSTNATAALVLTERVVNGDEAPAGRFPYVGYLRAYDCTPSTLYGDCGSTLLMPRAILTAGHCLFECSKMWDGLPGETQNPAGFNYTYGDATVKLNRWDLAADEQPGGEEHVITQVARHEDYKRDNAVNIPAQNDLALLELDGPSDVKPVRLYDQEEFGEGMNFQVAGWGSTDAEGTEFPNIIR
jgi:secreted trypsin-like serine protease